MRLKMKNSINNNNAENKTNSNLYVLLCIFSVTCVLISNILAAKIILLFGFSVAGGVLVFPLAYITGDVIAEVYGYKKSKQAIFAGFGCNLLMVVFFQIAILLPYPSYWDNQNAFSAVLGSTPRIFIASVVGYIVGSLSNSYVLNAIKGHSKNKHLSFRMIISSVVGEILDTGLFVLIAFLGNIEAGELLIMIVVQSIIKTGYEIVLTPLTCKIIKYVSMKEYEQQRIADNS